MDEWLETPIYINRALVYVKCMIFVRSSLTNYKFNTILTLRLENESFAGDAFMRRPIFLFNILPTYYEELNTGQIMSILKKV